MLGSGYFAFDPAMEILGFGLTVRHQVDSSFTDVLFPYEVCGSSGRHWQLFDGRKVLTSVPIDLGRASSCTLYDWYVTQIDSEDSIHVSPGEYGSNFLNFRDVLGGNDFGAMISLCAGMGGCMVGAHSAGFHTIIACDKSPLACSYLKSNFETVVIEGNLLDDAVVKELHRAKGEWHPWIEAGYPCQPYSNLGDKRAWQDDRARTFEGILRIGYLLQVRGLVPECVTGASKCVELRHRLHSYSQMLDFAMIEGIQNLDNFWPSRRSRWWVILFPQIIA